MPEPLTVAEVEHVAKLARLRLTADQIEACRRQLSTVLDHIATLSELDVDGVEPMAYPSDLVNRLADDVVEPSMTLDDLLRNAPGVEGDFIAVPKVLGDGGGA
ncbi:MAG: Asp-tRNA(Asn)/Glu-tRNA(Gln) amidotransferase subunit GatC [Phycisphaerales bacterium]|nr:Asp-tRNA(Asn)/Glu-tRNA(Gln) amidotransferase subunit GatC [Phycisphaerales bacterium]